MKRLTIIGITSEKKPLAERLLCRVNGCHLGAGGDESHAFSGVIGNILSGQAFFIVLGNLGGTTESLRAFVPYVYGQGSLFILKGLYSNEMDWTQRTKRKIFKLL